MVTDAIGGLGGWSRTDCSPWRSAVAADRYLDAARLAAIVYTGRLTASFDVSADTIYTARSTLLGETTFAAIAT